MTAQIDEQGMAMAHGEAMSVGAQLRAAREARGLSVGDVAFSLKLNPRQVEALETDRFDLLPGRAFARGFLKNYARHLELDPRPLLDAIEQADGVGAMELAPVSNAQGTMPTADARLRPSVFPAALVAMALLLVVAAGWYFDWFQQPEIAPERSRELLGSDAGSYQAPVVAPPLQGIPANVEVLPATPPATAPLTPPNEPPAPATQGEPVGALPAAAGSAGKPSLPTQPVTPALVVTQAAPPPVAAAANKPVDVPELAGAPAKPSIEPKVAGQESLVFRFSEDAWVEVRDGSGRIILSRIGRGGSVEEVQGNPPFSLIVGNAAKVSLQHEGEAVDLAPHTRVSVARLKLE